jgi:hypothetical protein
MSKRSSRELYYRDSRVEKGVINDVQPTWEMVGEAVNG